jgi:WD40 repeat protein/serine/threonine protein kinase
MSAGSVDPSAFFKGVSPAQSARLLALLDESLDLGPAEQETWLARLESTEPELAPLLRKLLTAQDRMAAQGFLETLSPLSEPSPAAEPELIGKQLGPYRIVSLLGHGGMGSVWLAERADGLFNRQVALKLIRSSLTGRVMAERFSREREILASLSHPNIARLFDAGFAADGQPYLALEYIPGIPLKTYCDEHRLTVNARLELFRQVLAAVQYAHARLVIHRDLKPSNILVTEDGQVHLLDFGIAKLLPEGAAQETELTRLGGLAMTPDYAAPEQVTGAPVTIAADIYSLGVMLYELCSGERPYHLPRDTRGALEEAILNSEPVPFSRGNMSPSAAANRGTTPRKLAKALGGDLETIVAKSLKKLPAERYPTAIAFSDDLGRFLRGDVVTAQRDSLGYRTVKYVRRNRLGLGIAALLVLALAITSYEARIAAKQRDAALDAQSRSLTQTAAGRVRDNDITGLAIILEVLGNQDRPYTPEALSVFQEGRAADLTELVLTGHSDQVRSIVYSPEGSRVLTASYDKTARIWDARTGKQILVLSGHTQRVRFAAFSPDGKRIVTASLDKTARIWDAQTGKQLQQFNGHSDRVRSAGFSPDGRRVVTGGYDNTARIWDVGTGAEIRAFKGHTGVITATSFSPDGKRVVSAAHDNTARVWDVESGREILQLNKHAGDVNWAQYSPDGTRIVTASGDKTARIWDARTGEQLSVLSGHTQLLESAVFSPDGQRIVTSSDDKTARVWDASNGRQMMVLSGHAEQVIYATFSPDGSHIATAADDNTARIWSARQDGDDLQLAGHSQLLAGADFSPDGSLVGTGSADKTARIWDAATGRQLAVLNGHEDLVLSAEFSPDGKRVVTASNDNTARIWDVASGHELLALRGHTQPVEGAAFSPDGSRIVTCSFDKTARFWDAATGAPVSELKGHEAAVNWVAWSPDGKRIVTASFDKTARIWSTETGNQLVILTGHSGTVATASFSFDGKHIVTASDDKTARIWDAVTGQQLLILNGHTDRVTSASFSPNDERIITSSLDKTARIWDALTGQQLMAARHTELVETSAWAPDGIHFVTASDDKLAHIWTSRIEPVKTQVLWAEAAQFDPLPQSERLLLGLPPATRRAQKSDATALARLGERAEASDDPLRAFEYYAAAAEASHSQGMPDDTWKDWRYRRAYLARLLARQGKMADVAKRYAEVRQKYAPHSAALLTSP